MNGHFRFSGEDPFLLFEKIQAIETMNPSHAFYLGYEMAKAVTALTLGKQYRQDAALNWGHLTVPEKPILKIEIVGRSFDFATWGGLGLPLGRWAHS